MNHFGLLITMFSLVCAFSACTASSEPAATAAPTVPPTGTPLPTATAANTATPEPTATPSSTPTPAPLTSKAIFNRVSPAVAFLETALGQGSGILLEGGMILTNAHVVWPYDKVRVLFADGSEYDDVPLVSWDLLIDLAVIGPIETDITPMSLSAREMLDIGSNVYLVGYPGEVDTYPQPAITRGLISRIREFEPAGVTYFQTDAMIGGGQSGGMLVTEYGEVMGVSTFKFSDAEFGLVASGADIKARVDELAAGVDTGVQEFRPVPISSGERAYSAISIDHEWDKEVYQINEPAGSDVEVTVEGGRNDMGVTILDVFGRIVASADERSEGQEVVNFTTEIDAPYYIVIDQYAWVQIDPITIESNRRMIPMIDLDDGRGLRKVSSYSGSLDYPWDTDFFQLFLKEGDKINVVVRSIGIDPLIIIGQRGDANEQLVSDDDSGGGMFGEDAELSFIAPDSGNYLLIVRDSLGTGHGGYALEVRDYYSGAPTPVVPPPTPEAIQSEFGPMDVYFSQRTNLAFLYPWHWSALPIGQDWEGGFCSEATACYASGDDLLIVLEEDLSDVPINSLAEYADLFATLLNEDGIRILSRESFTTDSGLEGLVLTIDFFELFRAKRFMLMQDEMVFHITYITEASRYDAMWPVAEFSFASVKTVE